MRRPYAFNKVLATKNQPYLQLSSIKLRFGNKNYRVLVTKTLLPLHHNEFATKYRIVAERLHKRLQKLLTGLDSYTFHTLSRKLQLGCISPPGGGGGVLEFENSANYRISANFSRLFDGEGMGGDTRQAVDVYGRVTMAQAHANPFRYRSGEERRFRTLPKYGRFGPFFHDFV